MMPAGATRCHHCHLSQCQIPQSICRPTPQLEHPYSTCDQKRHDMELTHQKNSSTHLGYHTKARAQNVHHSGNIKDTLCSRHLGNPQEPGLNSRAQKGYKHSSSKVDIHAESRSISHHRMPMHSTNRPTTGPAWWPPTNPP